MKNLVLVSAFAVLATLILAGCGEKPSNSSTADPDSQLTASDLARLMDFHAWNVRIPPQSQQSIKRIRLVIVKPDGTTIQKFCTANHDGYLSCSTILLGFRVEHGTFTGHFNMRDSNGSGEGYSLAFSDAFADAAPAWETGTPTWHGNRAELARARKVDELEGTVLAIELVK
jgi:hypothetical protein